MLYFHKLCLKIRWHYLTRFNMRDYPHIHESILFDFRGDNDDAIAINYCILHGKHSIYIEKLNNQNILTVDFLSYLSHLKYILKLEKTNIFSFIIVCFCSFCISQKYQKKYEKILNLGNCHPSYGKHKSWYLVHTWQPIVFIQPGVLIG